MATKLKYHIKVVVLAWNDRLEATLLISVRMVPNENHMTANANAYITKFIVVIFALILLFLTVF